MLTKILNCYNNIEFIKVDGFDDAIIGVDETNFSLIYSVNKCIEILMKDMSYEDALEYFSFNVEKSCSGDNKPIWCHDNFIEPTFDCELCLDTKTIKIKNISVDCPNCSVSKFLKQNS